MRDSNDDLIERNEIVLQQPARMGVQSSRVGLVSGQVSSRLGPAELFRRSEPFLKPDPAGRIGIALTRCSARQVIRLNRLNNVGVIDS